MNAEPLERDAVKAIRWELDAPSYRVDFWHQLPPQPGDRAETMGYKQDAYRVSGVADFGDVLTWAQENAAGRSFVIYVEVTRGGEPGIARLHGVSPTLSIQAGA